MDQKKQNPADTQAKIDSLNQLLIEREELVKKRDKLEKVIFEELTDTMNNTFKDN